VSVEHNHDTILIDELALRVAGWIHCRCTLT
jgi:hypothetical protein